MTTPIIKIKVLPKPVIKGKALIHFPARVVAEEFLKVTNANGVYTFEVDYTQLDTAPIVNASEALVAIYDQISASYKANTVSQLLQQAPTVEQHITSAGPVTVNNGTGIVRVDQTVGAAITINLPAAANKTCPVIIADWKGDAATHNITIVPNGAEKVQGAATWTIIDNNGGVYLFPISGVGYVIADDSPPGTSTTYNQRVITSAGGVTVNSTDDQIIFKLGSASAIAITLPAASTRSGRPLIVKDYNGTAAAANFTLTPDGFEKIDGASTLVISINKASYTLVPITGTGWAIA